MVAEFKKKIVEHKMVASRERGFILFFFPSSNKKKCLVSKMYNWSWRLHLAVEKQRVVMSFVVLGGCLIFWQPPPSRFVKVNFDGSVRDNSGGIGYVIHSPDGRLLAAGGSLLTEMSINPWCRATGILDEHHLCSSETLYRENFYRG